MKLIVDGVVEVRHLPESANCRREDPSIRVLLPLDSTARRGTRRRRRRGPPPGRGEPWEVVLGRPPARDVEAVVVAPDVEDGALRDARGSLQSLEQVAVGLPLGAGLAGAAVARLGVSEVAGDEQRDRRRRPRGRRRRGGRRRRRKRPPGRRDDRRGPGHRVRGRGPLGGEQGRARAGPVAEVEVGELEEDGRESCRWWSCGKEEEERRLRFSIEVDRAQKKNAIESLECFCLPLLTCSRRCRREQEQSEDDA